MVPNRPEAIRDAVGTALADAASMGARAREHVLAQHGRATVVEQLERYLLAL